VANQLPLQAHRYLGVNMSTVRTVDDVAVVRMYEKIDTNAHAHTDAHPQPMHLKYCAETDYCWQIPWCSKKSRLLFFEFFDLSGHALDIAVKDIIFQCGGERPDCPAISFYTLGQYDGFIQVEDDNVRNTRVFCCDFESTILRDHPPDSKHPLEAYVHFWSFTTGLLLSRKVLKVVKGAAGRSKEAKCLWRHGSILTCVLPHSMGGLNYVVRVATCYGSPIAYVVWFIINYFSRAVGFGLLRMIGMEDPSTCEAMIGDSTTCTGTPLSTSNIYHPMISMLGNRWIAERYHQKLTEYKNTTLLNHYIYLYRMGYFEASIAGLQQVHHFMEENRRGCAGWLLATFTLIAARWSEILICLQCSSSSGERIRETLVNECQRSVDALERAFSSDCDYQKQHALDGYVDLCDILHHWPMMFPIPKKLHKRIQKLRNIFDIQLEGLPPQYSRCKKMIERRLQITSVLGRPTDMATMERCHAFLHPEKDPEKDQDPEKDVELKPTLRDHLRETLAKHITELHMRTNGQSQHCSAHLQRMTDLALNPRLGCDVPLVTHILCQLSKWSSSRPELSGLAAEYATSLEKLKATPVFEPWKGTGNLMDPSHHDPCQCIQSVLPEKEAVETASQRCSEVRSHAKRGPKEGGYPSKKREGDSSSASTR
jgi:hypothetical protein